jgi:hypothetical protein
LVWTYQLEEPETEGAPGMMTPLERDRTPEVSKLTLTVRLTPGSTMNDMLVIVFVRFAVGMVYVEIA